jgi:hypothetical protein
MFILAPAARSCSCYNVMTRDMSCLRVTALPGSRSHSHIANPRSQVFFHSQGTLLLASSSQEPEHRPTQGRGAHDGRQHVLSML